MPLCIRTKDQKMILLAGIFQIYDRKRQQFSISDVNFLSLSSNFCISWIRILLHITRADLRRPQRFLCMVRG